MTAAPGSRAEEIAREIVRTASDKWLNCIPSIGGAHDDLVKEIAAALEAFGRERMDAERAAVANWLRCRYGTMPGTVSELARESETRFDFVVELIADGFHVGWAVGQCVTCGKDHGGPSTRCGRFIMGGCTCTRAKGHEGGDGGCMACGDYRPWRERALAQGETR